MEVVAISLTYGLYAIVSFLCFAIIALIVINMMDSREKNKFLDSTYFDKEKRFFGGSGTEMRCIEKPSERKRVTYITKFDTEPLKIEDSRGVNKPAIRIKAEKPKEQKSTELVPIEKRFYDEPRIEKDITPRKKALSYRGMMIRDYRN
jgi:hypothetical protein